MPGYFLRGSRACISEILCGVDLRESYRGDIVLHEDAKCCVIAEKQRLELLLIQCLHSQGMKLSPDRVYVLKRKSSVRAIG